ncbi:MAG: Clp protease N-terminal domain-containing protein [Pseudonocardiaceae bacterium]
MTLEELITQTRAHAQSFEPLTQLASAARRQQELADLGEQLLDHFVQEARAAGYSWSQVGTALGVSKQAAQQRHSVLRSFIGKLVGDVESFTGDKFKRFTHRARRTIVLAQEEARLLCHDHLGTEHLLLGLLAEGEGIGGRALAGAGVTLDAARAGVEEITGRGQTMLSGHIRFTPGAKKVLELALCEALELDHNYIGTEHLLFALLTDREDTPVRILLAANAQPDQLRVTALALLERAAAPSGAE